MDKEWLRHALRANLAIICVALVLCGLLIGGARLLQRERLVIPDEKAVAAELLAQKLSGPRYFQSKSPTATNSWIINTPRPHEGGPLISVADAKAQVERIVRERQLDAEQAAKVHRLIDQLTEPPDSRMIGEASINLLRLNLALDEVR